MEAVQITEVAPWVPTNTFGARLALIRQRHGWNVSEAATACGLDAGSWHNWELGKGTRRFEEITAQIADRTPCDLAWLRGLTGLDGTDVLQATSREPHLRTVPTMVEQYLPGFEPNDPPVPSPALSIVSEH